MKNINYIVLFFLFQFSVYSQEFSLLRQNDNLEALDTINFKSSYLKLKKTNLTKNTTLSFGGSWRFQAESFINEQFQKEGNQDNIWYLNRFLLHSHLKVSDKFELFAELGSSLATGKNDKSPVDKDILYVNQLFAKYQITKRWDIAAGRHNIRLGSGRLVDIREGPNVRRIFDFAEVNYQTEGFKVKSFFSIPVKPAPDALDNDVLKFDETFSGIYTTTNFSKATNIDFYLLYQKDDGAVYNNGIANERRSSLGVRHFGKHNKWVFNNEFVYQFGRFGNQDISAWTISFLVERGVNLFGKDIGLGIKTETISGDKNANDNKMNSFDALYPRGAYFGRVARFGPSNLLDVHPYITVSFNKFSLELDYDAFWRYSIQDGVYGAALTLDYPDTNDERFIANQIGANLALESNGFMTFELETNLIFPGAFLNESGLSDTLYHFVLTTEIKF